MCRFRKELYTYVGLFFFLSIAMHFSAWLNYPVEHIFALKSSSLGTYHPFIITLVFYLLILMIRLVVEFFKKLKS